MPTLGIELCDAGLITAACEQNDPKLIDVADRNGAADWPGFAYHEGNKFTFGRSAEDMWFIQPRRVAHTFWNRLAHEPSTFGVPGKPPSISELCFLFLREFTERLTATTGKLEKIVLAVPGAYLKDTATEEEKIGLLLGMASELKLPLAGIIDMSCAALCDPRAPGFNPALPVLVVDVQLTGADLSLFSAEEKLERRDFLHVPNSGLAHLLKHLTGTMGNRFLRHTAFDILEDGRIEQTFYRQTKDFLFSHAAERRYQINTATRNYETLAKHEQLASDAQAFATALTQSMNSFIEHAGHAPGLCTVALTGRTAIVPGLEAKLRTAGFSRQIRLPVGAAAAGAARMGAARLRVPADLGDVPVETSALLSDTRRVATTAWETRLQKAKREVPRPAPTHAIFEGIGYSLGANGRFTIGAALARADLALPESFPVPDDCVVALKRDGGRLWFVDTTVPRAGTEAPMVAVESGDRLTIRSGPASAEVLFAHCPGANGAH